MEQSAEFQSDSWSSSQQHSHELAQLVVLRNWKETETYKNDVHLLPTELDEKVATMRLPTLGTVLTDFLDFSSSEKFKNSPLVAAHPS